MLELIALIMIAAGIFLVIRGLTERVEVEYPGMVLEEQLEEQEEWEEYEWRKRKEEPERAMKPKKEVKAGGVVLIGPIPIIFGDSKYASLALILAIILMILSLLYIFSLQAVV